MNGKVKNGTKDNSSNANSNSSNRLLLTTYGTLADMKKCNKCQVHKKVSEFYSNKSMKDGLCHYCIDCEKERNKNRVVYKAKYQANWRSKNPERNKELDIKHRKKQYQLHGLTKEAYEDMCKNGCQICGSKDNRLVVDHDHACCDKDYSCGQCIRGILCYKCNSGLGMLGDNLKGIRRAVHYLERWQLG